MRRTETFQLNLTEPDGDPVKTAIGTIRDDDATPTYGFSASANPVGEDAGPVIVTATLSAVSGRTVTIPFATADGTATDGQDYTGSSGSVVIPAGSPSNTITVPITNDTRDEPDQTFALNASSGTGVANTDSITVTITDNDSPPVMSIGGAGAEDEGDPLTFPVSLTAASEKTVTATVNTSNGTATAGSDYTAISGGTVTFAPLDTAESVVVTTSGDAIDEGNETLSATLSAANNATLGTATAGGTIDDDNNAPDVTLTPGAVTEGNGGTAANQTFTATLGAASGQEVLLDYTVGGGTATVGTDYTATSGTLTFAPGDTVETFNLPVVGDLIDENPSETVNITLSNDEGTVSGGDLGSNSVTITDDDATPTFSVANETVTEGDTGSEEQLVTVTLSGPSSQAVDFDVVYANGTAVNNDWDGGSTTASVAAGQTTATVEVSALGDEVYEGDEDFTVEFALAGGETGATGAADTATVTIEDDEDVPTITLSSETAAEGTSAVVDATISGVAEDDIDFDVTAAGAVISGSNAAEVGDFTNPGLQSHTIPGGSIDGFTVANVMTLPATGDTFDEPTETVRVSGAVTSGTATFDNGVVSITDDAADGGITASLGDFTVAESGGNATVAATLAFPGGATASQQSIVVNYETSNGTAASGTDYTAKTGSVTFAPGDTSEDITVAITDDAVDEVNQTFSVTITSVTPSADVSVADGTGVVTITDNDNASGDAIAVTLGDATVAEGTANASVPVSLSFPNGGATSTERTVEIDITTTADSATAGSDYTTTSGSVTFVPGDTSENFLVPILNDTIDEAAESFEVSVTGVDPADVDVLGGGSTVTLNDNDAAPQLSLGDVTVAEAAGNAVVPATLSFSGGTTATAQTVVANYTTTNGAGTSGFDYTTTAGSVTFVPGDVSENITVPILDDTVDEASGASFTVNVTGITPLDVTAADGSASVSINDNDTGPEISVGDLTVGEAAGTAAVPVSLGFIEGATGTERTITVNYATSNGSALSGSDYTATSGSVTFVGGDVSESINVPITNDTTDEGNQTFGVTLSSFTPVGGATLADSSATVTITDNDNPSNDALSLSVADATVGEAAGTASVVATLGFAGGATGTDRTITVDYATSGGTAQAGSDYTTTTGTLTFVPGDTSETISVPILNDTIDEATQDFVVSLGTATPGDVTVSDGIAAVSITDNDAAPQVSLGDVTVGEAAGNAVVPATLGFSGGTTSTQQTVVVNYTTTAGAGTAGADYTTTAGSVTFTPGDTSEDITVPVLDDAIDEANGASFTVNVTSITPGEVVAADGSATVSITDNDAGAQVTASDLTVSEAAGTAAVPVGLSFIGGATGTDRSTTVNYTTSSGSATAGSDFTTSSGSLTFVAGDISEVVNVPIINDTSNEGDQTFTVTLSGALPTGTVLADASSTVTITDNDTNNAQLLLSAGDVDITEGAGTADVPVTLSFGGGLTATDRTVTVAYSTSPGTALAGSDYTTSSGTVTFAPGDTSETISIPVIDDTVDENNGQDFTVNLGVTTPVGVTLADGIARVTLDDNDSGAQVSFGDVSVNEAAGTAAVPVTLGFLNGGTATEKTVTVGYTTANGTAIAGSDYTSATGTLTFVPGDLTETITVPITNDAQDEYNQTFTVSATTYEPTGTALADGSATVTIVDDDASQNPTMTAPQSRVGAGDVTISGVTRPGAPVELLVVKFPSEQRFVGATTTADADGAYSFTYPISVAHVFRVRAITLTSESQPTLVEATAKFTAVSPSRGRVQAWVNTDPDLANQRVAIQRVLPDQTVKTLVSGRTDANGNFTTTMVNLPDLPSGAARRLVAYVYADFPNTGVVSGYSNEDVVTTQ